MPNLKLELEKVRELRAMLGDDDPELVHDTLEGQTDIYEVIDWLLGKIAEEETFQEAIASRITGLKERSKASEGRVGRLRGVLSACLHATGEKTLRRPEATLTVGWSKPGIQTIDESLLPERFFVTKREVSRSTILNAIREGEKVPGVLMSNGNETLTIRRK